MGVSKCSFFLSHPSAHWKVQCINFGLSSQFSKFFQQINKIYLLEKRECWYVATFSQTPLTSSLTEIGGVGNLFSFHQIWWSIMSLGHLTQNKALRSNPQPLPNLPPPPHPPTPQLKINIDRCIMQILESVVHINLWPRWTTFFRTYIYNSSPHTQPYLIILLYIKCKCYKEIPRGLIARCNAIHRTGLN